MQSTAVRRKPNCFNLLHQLRMLGVAKSMDDFDEVR